MELAPVRVEVEATVGGSVVRGAAPAPIAGTAAVGPIEVDVAETASPGFAWRVANAGDVPARVRSVSLVFSLVDAVEPLRIFRNGYQSWSPTGVVTFGVDVDPSTKANFEFLQGVHHADQRRALDDELRSEWVTVLHDSDRRGEPILVGFDGGDEHDGTLRIRRGSDGDIEVWAQAFLGDAVIEGGTARTLHDVVLDVAGGGGSPGAAAGAALRRWADRVGAKADARVHAPFQVGWCSWYHYFYGITEEALRSNLARNDDWPFDVFQLDDGFQTAIGDWLVTNDTFPSPLDVIAGDIAAAGRVPGLWIAPFLAAPDSQLATAHPDWIARHLRDTREDTGPLRGWWNPDWGGGEDGFMYALDTTNPEVVAHLEELARDLVDAGFRYLKLDFTFAPSFDGGWMDPTRTPAQRVRAGYEAIRRGAGDDTFILGCGVPLSNVVGIVDGNRIGQDVAPLWDLPASAEVIPGYLGVQPSTQFAYGNTVNRAFMHRRLWLNDPDCVMLRTTETKLSPEAARGWAQAVGVSGGMVLVSDDLALLGDDARALLDETLTIGRASDAAALEGATPTSDRLLDEPIPSSFAAAGYELTLDRATGAASLSAP